jgi:hypothetical protein
MPDADRHPARDGGPIADPRAQTLAPVSAIRFLAVLSGLLLLVAILGLGWHDEAPSGGLGGGYAVGRGLWGVGVRLPWIVPMVILATSAVVVAGAFGRSRIAALAWSVIGLMSILLVVVVDRGGTGYVCAITAASMLVLTGVLAALMAHSSRSSGTHPTPGQESGSP